MLTKIRSLLSIEGRISRKEWWRAQINRLLVFLVTGLIMFGVLSIVEDDASDVFIFLALPVMMLGAIVIIVASFYTLAQSIRRFHDRDKSGWWVLITLIPYLGTLWLIIELGCLKGNPGSNKYGEDPKLLLR